jgi:serine/threonine protein kinase
MRLDVYLSKESPNFEEKIMIILALIDLVKEIHQCGVVHRNLTPSKIYLYPFVSTDEENGFRLQLIDFDFAHLPPEEIQRTNDTSLLQIDNPVTNNFYLPV